MIAKTQYSLVPEDLLLVLALVRVGTLAEAGERLRLDASTVFRALQRLERSLGVPLFDRSRAGYAPTELAQSLAAKAEEIEATLEAAHSLAQMQPDQVSGTVRITTTDTVLHGLIAPALLSLQAQHPLLKLDLHTGNELASLTRRDADIALRATQKPPQHLIGKQLGIISVAVFAAKKSAIKNLTAAQKPGCPWIGPDDALPEHPSVLWRKKNAPKAHLQYRVSSILSVAELVSLGLAVGILPIFLAKQRNDLRQLSEPLAGSETGLWLLTHTEARHLPRVSNTFTHLAKEIKLV